MKRKITKKDYNDIKADFANQVSAGILPSLIQQSRSKKRRRFYEHRAKLLNCYEGTIRRVVKSKNYAEYLRLGRENRGTSTKRKTTYIGSVPSVFTYQPEPKPKKYKTTIIATEAVIPDDWIIKDTIKAGHLISYTVEVL